VSYKLPCVHFGDASAPKRDWRTTTPDTSPDDDALTETPWDVEAMLGFDPVELESPNFGKVAKRRHFLRCDDGLSKVATTRDEEEIAHVVRGVLAKLKQQVLDQIGYLVPLKKAYNPDEPRDNQGKWTDGGESSVDVSTGGDFDKPKMAMSRDDARTLATKMFAGLPGKWSVSVAPHYQNGRDIVISGVQKDENDETITSVIRVISKDADGLHAEHTIFSTAVEGKGLAKQVLSQEMSAYKEIGIKDISLNANITVGGYAWAKFGFHPTYGAEIEAIGRGAARRIGGERGKEVGELLASGKTEDFWRVADSLDGKEALLGSSWHGKLSLNDAVAMQRFNSYVSQTHKRADDVAGTVKIYEWPAGVAKPANYVDGMRDFLDDAQTLHKADGDDDGDDDDTPDDMNDSDIDIAADAANLDAANQLIVIHPITSRIAVTAARKAADSTKQYMNSDVYDQVDQNAINYAKKRGAELVTQVTDTTRGRLRKIISSAVQNGMSASQLRDAVSDDFSFSNARALMIARTEAAFADVGGAMSGYRTMQNMYNLVMRKSWLVAAQCCDLCQGNEDQGPIPFDEPFLSGDDAPPGHPNCLPGYALVTSGSRITSVSKRWYDGDMIVIRTASGKNLPITPNHPILTRHGWIAPSRVKVGDDLVCRHWDTDTSTFCAAELDHEHMPTSIEHIANAFYRSNGIAATTIPVAAEDFHGDGIDSNVAVIGTDLLLRNNSESGLNQNLYDRDFILTIVQDFLLPRDGTLLDDFKRVLLSAPRRMSVADLLGALLRCHLLPLQQLGFALGAQHDTDLYKVLSHARPTCAAHQLNHGGATEVFLDKVVNIEVVRFTGHVYNLETESGHYTANGVVVHNCRCDLAVETVQDDQL